MMDDDKKILCAVTIALFVLIYFIIVASALTKKYENNKVYAEGIEAFEAGDYDKVLEILQPLGDYKEAAKYIEYSKAVKAFEAGDYILAARTFIKLEFFKDSYEYALKSCYKMIERSKDEETVYQLPDERT